jgi:hypothetical protein
MMLRLNVQILTWTVRTRVRNEHLATRGVDQPRGFCAGKKAVAGAGSPAPILLMTNYNRAKAVRRRTQHDAESGRAVAYVEGRMEDHAALMADIRVEMRDLRADMRADFRELRSEMNLRFDRMDQKFFLGLLGVALQVARLQPS